MQNNPFALVDIAVASDDLIGAVDAVQAAFKFTKLESSFAHDMSFRYFGGNQAQTLLSSEAAALRQHRAELRAGLKRNSQH